ncbi:terminase large subunit domain-containing protein [Dyella telluris]|uniref:Terminase n=1 Tax=Dyella telluris TaxID=2763498 RepID=A0A7G8Q2G7_9GAMM|nr:terminase family protein [Dyella telluris]QNK00975.1 terminase [Dyella telluris]
MSKAALDFQRAADPSQVFTEGVSDAEDNAVTPAPWQHEVMRSEARRHLILCNRQAGKSTTIGAKAAGGLIYAPGLYLIVAPTLRQSRLLFEKTRAIYKRLSGVPRIVTDNANELVLENGSHLVALPGDNDATIRGYSAPRAVYIDEAARVSDAVYAAVRPMLAASANGQLIALTTPYGRRGWFYEQWSEGQHWTRTTITANDCPHITPEFLAEERDSLSEWQFRAEMLCEFVDTDEAFFSSELVDAMTDANLEAWS